MKASLKAIRLIKESESLAKLRPDGLVEAYPDPAKGWAVPTIGWGTTGSNVTRETVWTISQCEQALKEHVAQLEAKVSKILEGSVTNQNQFDALIDFAYNLGIGNLSSSTLLGLHKQGRFEEAKAQFGRWVKAGKKVLQGLVIRRKKEADLYDDKD